MALTVDLLRRAFARMGAILADEGRVVELAVYGGSAIMLQFDWRAATEDVDAVVREGYDERAIAPVVATVAAEFGLEADWLNDAVGMFTPLVERDGLFEVSGEYPVGSEPGLRVLVATPSYLLAMKLMALANPGRGTKDMDDARRLAAEVGIVDEAALLDLYRSVHDEPPAPFAHARFPGVVGR